MMDGDRAQEDRSRQERGGWRRLRTQPTPRRQVRTLGSGIREGGPGPRRVSWDSPLTQRGFGSVTNESAISAGIGIGG